MNTIAPATSINYLSHLVDVFVSVLFLLLFLLFGTPLDSAFLDAPVCFCVYAHSSNGESLELFFFSHSPFCRFYCLSLFLHIDSFILVDYLNQVSLAIECIQKEKHQKIRSAVIETNTNAFG